MKHPAPICDEMIDILLLGLGDAVMNPADQLDKYKEEATRKYVK
ncbi:hypothetical protein [Shimazuella soli]|nr:hypothetical protein [Shimazuella soli]